MKKKSLEEAIKDFKHVHGSKYDYSNVEYNGTHNKVCIICPKLGEFWQTPHAHLQGQGCKECGKEQCSLTRTKTYECFEKEAKIIHNGKYAYHQDYKKDNIDVKINCPIHGDFKQKPSNHLHGQGCPKCKRVRISNKKKKTVEVFESEASVIHGGKYAYHQDYNGNKIKIRITCPIHGDFLQIPSTHLSGGECPKCKGKNKTTEECVKEFQNVHGDKFDYSKVVYEKCDKKICIICPIHGEFWQTPQKHLMGQGCPKCNTSKLEQTIKNLLKEHNIAFEEQKHFKWLGKQSLDFYLPKQRIAIECQGIQHFEERKYFGGFIGLKNTIKRDKHKLELCMANNVKIIYYANYYYNFPYNVITNTVELLKEITMI